MKKAYSRHGQHARRNSRAFAKQGLIAFLLALSVRPIGTGAATAPAATLLYTTINNAPIRGGVATIGSSGVTYFSTLSTPSTRANVTALNLSGAQPKWTFPAPGDGTSYDMYPVPALDAAGQKLYVGSDYGIFYCRNTADGTPAVGWTDFTVPGTGDRRIRSGAALDPNGPLGSTVYFQCNDGYLYALDANTGAQRWRAATGNGGGPPPVPSVHEQPVSSSPVVSSDGSVYVASANGHVYRFNAANGAQLMDKIIGLPIEAPLAIGNNGWLYGATRSSGGAGQAFAINPVNSTIVWQVGVPTIDPTLGVIASPVIDQKGFVYVADYGHSLVQFDGATGEQPRSWNTDGKLCQAPTLLQNGLLLLGQSFYPNSSQSELTAFKIYGDNGAFPVWTSTGTAEVPMAVSLFGATAVRCTSTWYIFIADTGGHVYRLSGTDPMMAGQWPTLACGNRRAGKSITYPTAIAELPAFYFNSFTDVHSLDHLGRAVGQAYGYYDNACGHSDIGYAAALWRNNSVSIPGGCAAGSYLANTYANAINEFGDVVGYYSNNAIVWPDGANSGAFFTTLTKPTGFSSANATALNALSTIVGYGNIGSDVHAVQWAKFGGAWPNSRDLMAPAGGQAYVYGITDDGRIAGKAKFTSGGPFHAFNTFGPPTDLTSEAVDLGTMGGTASEAWGMHEQKGTVGRSQISAGYWRAFFLPIDCSTLGGVITYQIPALPGVTRTDWSSAAYGLNKGGQVVGYTQDQNLANRAFRYNSQTGITTDLNTITLDGGQTPTSLGWTLTKAQAINEPGIIVGAGVQNSVSKSWILYPKCQD